MWKKERHEQQNKPETTKDCIQPSESLDTNLGPSVSRESSPIWSDPEDLDESHFSEAISDSSDISSFSCTDAAISESFCSSTDGNSNDSDSCTCDSSDSDSSVHSTVSCFGEIDSKCSQNSESSIMADPSVKSLCTLSYILRYNVSREATNDLVRLLSVLEIDSKNNIDLNLGHSDDEYEVYHYCSLCNEIFPDDPNKFICAKENCNNMRYKGNLMAQTKRNRQPNAYFVMANIESQLKHLLEKGRVWQDIKEMKRKAAETKENICDIIHGSAYKALCTEGQFLHNEYNISGLFNTDGVPLYSSSNVKLWPIFIAINELPPSYRFS